MQIEHFTPEIFGTFWLRGILFVILFISSLFFIGKNSSKKTQLYLLYGMGIYQLVSSIGLDLSRIVDGTFLLSSHLPLQMCGITAYLSGIVVFYRKQFIFEFLYFWGLAGFIHSVLTPEFTTEVNTFTIINYYLSHSLIFVVPVWLMLMMDMRLKIGSWWTNFLYTQPLLIFVMIINWSVGGNYMYLAEAPLAENPLIFTRVWPWYILTFEFLVIAHFLIFYYFGKKSSIDKA
jgi:hypothetical integral membrane protein (TIGR02206 family)